MTVEDSLSMIEKEIKRLTPICQAIQKADSVERKLAILNQEIDFQKDIAGHPFIEEFLMHKEWKNHLIIKSLIVLGQAKSIFHHLKALKVSQGHDSYTWLINLVDTLYPVEVFYEPIGGLIGYHLAVIDLIYLNEKADQGSAGKISYSKPKGIDLSKESSEVRKAIREGIERLPELAEIYPVGGAGDRLNLLDEKNNHPLPAAQLLFCGRTLLEGLIRDLQAKEYLYYKLTGQQLITPVVMMTSQEKDNHQHILNICESKHWFGRKQDCFFLFSQPLVPVINHKGEWVLNKPLHLVLKPGGHGVIWKLAVDSGVFEWLTKLGRIKLLVRQINNPIAGTDFSLLAFTGIGLAKNKIFGFASCNRVLNTAEGMNVLVEKREGKHYQYGISNIEYTDFKRKGIKDIPIEAGSSFSAFPANTNILFADLKAVKNVAQKFPIPGMLINMKTLLPCLTYDNQLQHLPAGRLESTMQNIADFLMDTLDHPIQNEDQEGLSTYLTYNDRHKTISVTKKNYVDGQPLSETPEGCFYEVLYNYYDLLKHHCHMHLTPLCEMKDYLKQPLSFYVLLHPAIGPLYQIIGQKIQRGSLAPGAELQLEIAEVLIQDLLLEGSLIVTAESVLGDLKNQLIQYGENSGKCVLKSVSIKNQGIDFKAENHYWKGQIKRKESLRIVIAGNGEFYAENVTFKGDETIEVPSGFRVKAYADGDQVKYQREKISSPTWFWKYSFDKEDKVVLSI
jgi:UTP---glucose-1-phosphate uridylyltransferase